MGAWQEATFVTLEDLGARLLKIESAQAEFVALPTPPVSGRRDSPPPSTPRARLEALGSAVARVDARVTALEAVMKPRPLTNDVAQVQRDAASAPSAPSADANGPVTSPSTRDGDDGRRTSSRPPPPVEVVVDRGAFTSTDPTAHPLDVRVRRRWEELIAEAQEAGQDARHCQGATCFHEGEAIAVCECACGGCVLAGELLIAAKREITGRE